ncbi:hypothetical protein M885DRAFT_575794 [Pelagophyceae sp. CCMP2097]|nr:hypothetical protein M885DRAFT_575794 [Pelagophyceae sp. CCMP2097]
MGHSRALGCAGLVCAVLAVLRSDATAPALRSDADAAARLQSRAPATAIVSRNKYGVPSNDFWLYRFEGTNPSQNVLAEPHRRTTLSLTTPLPEKAKISWRITADAAQVRLESLGDTYVEIVVRTPGLYRVEARLATEPGLFVDAGEADARPLASAVLVCVYVRREVRSLDAEDSNRYFAAVKKLRQVSQKDGIEKYGAEYRPLLELAQVHLFRGANRAADELHDGLGFLPQHSALSNEFESMLQLIDASLALPYWDFTRDVAKTRWKPGDRGIRSLIAANLDLWRSDRFGAFEETADSNVAAVPNFFTEPAAFTRLGAESENDADTPNPGMNAYGYMRSPWNMNRAAFVQRYGSFCGVERPLQDWPSCSTHHAAVFDNSSKAEYLRSAGGAAHGGVHMMLGGVGGCADSVEIARLRLTVEEAWQGPFLRRLSDGARTAARDFVDRFIVDIKDSLQALWRFHLIEFPSSCSASEPEVDCHALCPHVPADAFDFVAIEWWRLNVFENGDVVAFLENLVGLPPNAWVAAYPKSAYPKYAACARVLCLTPWSFGEHAGAESPLDASFWPVHPTLDRLYQYKTLVRDFPAAGAWAPEAAMLCKYAANSKCVGHRAGDLTAFRSAVLEGGQRGAAFESAFLSNSAMLDAVSPKHYKMRYVYDAFRWPHCSKDFPPADGAAPAEGPEGPATDAQSNV